MIATESLLTVPLVHIHRWLDRMNVPPAPEDAGDGLWYRLGYLERAAASNEGNEEALLGKVVQHLNEACGGVKLQEGNAIEQFGELLGVVQELAVAAGGPPPPASGATGPAKGPVDALLDWKADAAWHPASEHPASGAVVEVELAQGTHRGEAQQVRGPDGVERLAVVSTSDQAVFWPAVRRWRFAG